MIKKRLVSIGIPTFNRPEFLERALGIITKQTYSEIEIIVSDNCSPNDKVKEILDNYAKVDSRIKCYYQSTNIGILRNTEFVFKKATGEFFMWFSDDDWRSPEFIELMVKLLDSNSTADMAFCDFFEVNEFGYKHPKYPKSHTKYLKYFESSSRFVRLTHFLTQPSSLGKCNIFYSLFRRKALEKIDFQKISNNYVDLNMDMLIAYLMLSNSKLAIHPEALCTLTCGNKKHYLSEENYGVSWIRKALRFFKFQLNEKRLLLENSCSLKYKIYVQFIFIFKFIYELIYLIFNSLEKKKAQEFYNNNLEKINLPEVTLIAMATQNVYETLNALNYSCKGVNFGSVKLLSHFTPYGLENSSILFYRIDKLKSIDEWSYKVVYELHNYVDTKYALLIHADGFVVNPDSWRMEFLNFDYIGAPWPLPKDSFSYRDVKGQVVRVGNSVSLRSLRLMRLPSEIDMPWEHDNGFYNEDGFICVKNKHIFEAYGMKFATLEDAKYFSHEMMLPDLKGIKPFVFHKWAGSNSKYPKF